MLLVRLVIWKLRAAKMSFIVKSYDIVVTLLFRDHLGDMLTGQ